MALGYPSIVGYQCVIGNTLRQRRVVMHNVHPEVWDLKVRTFKHF